MTLGVDQQCRWVRLTDMSLGLRGAFDLSPMTPPRTVFPDAQGPTRAHAEARLLSGLAPYGVAELLVGDVPA